jgi:hypothetical protein
LQSIDVFLDFMYLISYICQMKATDKKDSGIRELYFSDEFTEFYEKLQDKVKAKFEHTMDIIRTEYVLNTKFVKHLENTDLYEMRVSVNFNEYRTILFAVDNDNIILSKRILLLNGFLKKSTKDYSKQIKVAKQILEDFEL